jgi:hypothetical protein
MERDGRPPTASDVISSVEKWKIRRTPPIGRDDIARAIVELATQRWISVVPDASVEDAIEELTGV